MSNSLGVKELKEVINLILGGIKVGKDIMADGKVDFNDLALVMSLMPIIQPAFDGVATVPQELADLNEAEAQELIAHVMANLTVDDVKARKVVEASMKVAFSGFQLVKALQG